MKIVKRVLFVAGVAALAALPTQTAGAFWLGPGPGIGPWRHSYIYDPGYRWGSPAMRGYIRDLYLYGPAYANWRQQRRSTYRWW
jgi:hypothetical protein